MKNHPVLFLAFALVLVLTAKATDKSPATKWVSKNHFEQKVFIENKGQFDARSGNSPAKVLYGASVKGVELFFCASGLIYRHDEPVAMTAQENEAFERTHSKSGEKEEGKRMKTVPYYFSVEWLGSDPKCEIVAEQPVSYYFTYPTDATGAAIKANACKKITYKNLYPHIDVQYVFPADSSGIKYSIVLHPGANPNDIKMKYYNAEGISVDGNGNIVLKSSFGDFIDHAPQTFYANDRKAIASSFSLKNNVVSFSLPNLTGSGDVIIDPWTTNPVFTGYNAAYDLNYDASGNVYILGSYGPYQLIKLNSAGAIQWIYNAVNWGDCVGMYFYGDFALDEMSGASYLVEGVGNCSGSGGARVFKVNTLGIQTGTYPGNANFNEMWRAEYNRCINKIVIAGGTTSGNTQAAMLDTNLVNITPVNVLSASGGCYDMALLAVDNTSNFCYMATTTSVCGGPAYNNKMMKCPIPNLIPLVFSVSDGHQLRELNSSIYVDHMYQGQCPNNGINGMAVNANWLYTYDSDSLKRWNKNTGAFIAGVDVYPLAPIYGNVGGGIQVGWGGLTVDACDNIYIGLQASVKIYNSSLTLINTIALPDTVYDVKLGNNNDLYACGKNFVTQLTVPPNNAAVTFTLVPASCNACDGSATASGLCGGNPSNFTYAWSTVPVQTTQTASGLCPGVYTVTVGTGCSSSISGTVAISSNGVAVTPTTTNVSCFGGNDGALNVTASGTVVPTYTWSTGSNASGISNLSAGTYTVIVGGGACSSTLILTVTQPSPITYTGIGKEKCNGDTTSASIVVSGGTAGYVVNWTNPVVHTGNTIHGAAAGIYSGIITDTNNCQKAFTYTITQPSVLSGVTSSNYNCNVASSGTITVNPSGGIAPYTYNWPGHPGNNQNTLNNVGPGVYTVTVIDSNNCTRTFIDSVATYAPISLSVSGVAPCNGGTNGSATAVASGGLPGSPIQYSWTGTSGSTPSVSNLGPGTYTVTVTSGSCIKKATVTLVQGPLIDSLEMKARYCDGDVNVLIAGPTGTGIQNPFQWYQSAAIVANANSNSYSGNVADLSTYSVTWYHNGCKYITTQLLVDITPAIGQLKPTNIFTPNSDGQNDIYFPFENIPANAASYIESYSLVIFNRWGKQVFESSDITNGWNGKMENGNAADDGVYYWIAQLKSICATSSEGTFKGFVHLQR